VIELGTAVAVSAEEEQVAVGGDEHRGVPVRPPRSPPVFQHLAGEAQRLVGLVAANAAGEGGREALGRSGAKLSILSRCAGNRHQTVR
jgi:hypothetical protein